MVSVVGQEEIRKLTVSVSGNAENRKLKVSSYRSSRERKPDGNYVENRKPATHKAKN